MSDASERAPQPLAGRKSSRRTKLPDGPRFQELRLTVELRHCVSDNEKYMIGKGRRQIILQPEYRQAKETIGAIARRAMQNTQIALGPVVWEATVYFENNRRDLLNAGKLLQDSLNKIVYADDKQIVKSTWSRGENDKENPRVEITVRQHD